MRLQSDALTGGSPVGRRSSADFVSAPPWQDHALLTTSSMLRERWPADNEVLGLRPRLSLKE